MGLFPSLSRLCYLSLSCSVLELRSSNAHFRLSLKRIGVLLGLSLVLPLHCCLQHVGFALDMLFFPTYKRVSINRPVFIVSNARSGSTLLQRLVFSHSDHFSSISVWEMLFAQSISLRVLMLGLAKFDRLVLRGLASSLFARLNAGLSGWSAEKALHPFDLTNPDEDEWVMSSFGASQLLAFFFPILNPSSPIMRLADFDQSLTKSEKRAIWQAYKDVVRRHLYFDIHFRGRSPTIRYLSKNPTFTLRLDSLTEEFPDADFVVLVRDPYRAVPSMVSYISTIWTLVASPRQKYPYRDELQGMCSQHYTYPLEIMKRKQEQRFHLAKYEQLTNDPTTTTRNLLLAMEVPGAKEFCTQRTAFSTYRHSHSVQSVLQVTNEQFERRHDGAFQAYPEYRQTTVS